MGLGVSVHAGEFSPANLEAEVKQQPLVSQCVVIGDRRPYLVALLTLDPDEAVKFAGEHGLGEDPEAMSSGFLLSRQGAPFARMYADAASRGGG